MTPAELIQLMRTCSMAQVRKALEEYQKKNPDAYHFLEVFYTLASKKKP